MLRPRVIPVLTITGSQMVKTRRFGDPIYLGDPFNTVRIFNTKEVDELVILDITATSEGRPPDVEFIRDLAGECFMPLSYGGGIDTEECAGAILAAGCEKVVVNSEFLRRPEFVEELAAAFGSQAVVASVDVGHRRRRGPRVVRTSGGVSFTDRPPIEWLVELERRGAGEVLLASVDRDGTAEGYDTDLVRACSAAVDVPVIACGGAGSTSDLADVLMAGAAAAAAGRLFVTHGRHRAALISYPESDVIEGLGR